MRPLLVRPFALLLLVAYPTCSALAEPATNFPAWETLKLKNKELACYDLEGAKSLKIFQVQCEICEKKVLLYEQLLAKLEAQMLSAQKLALDAGTVITEQVTELKYRQGIIIEQQESLDRAEMFSITGAALPWVITGALLVGLGGFVAGVAL